jgi:monoamine oxidase
MEICNENCKHCISQVTTSTGEMYESKFVISALPLALLNRITFSPPLPAKKIQLIQRIPMGSIIKTMTFYDKPYWRLKGLSGQMATDSGPVQYTIDDTKPDGTAPCLMGFILADQVFIMVILIAHHHSDTEIATA